jgi:hypothetical protein
MAWAVAARTIIILGVVAAGDKINTKFSINISIAAPLAAPARTAQHNKQVTQHTHRQHNGTDSALALSSDIGTGTRSSATRSESIVPNTKVTTQDKHHQHVHDGTDTALAFSSDTDTRTMTSTISGSPPALRRHSVSGFSAGAAVAINHLVAFSGAVDGVGVIGASP